MPVIFSVLGWCVAFALSAASWTRRADAAMTVLYGPDPRRSTFGLAARCWQLALQKRNIFESQSGRLSSSC